jgi:hypothetical protein
MAAGNWLAVNPNRPGNVPRPLLNEASSVAATAP